MDTPTVAELIQLTMRAKNGDKQAFEQVYSHFFKPVYHYLLRRLKNPKDAEDLAQQVFLRLYTSATPFDNQAITPLAYLFTIAHNLANTFFTKQHATLELEDNDIPDSKKFTEIIELEQTLDQALNILSSEQREIIENKFKHGLTTHEIAVELGKTEVAIRQIQCRALRHLRDYLA